MCSSAIAGAIVDNITIVLYSAAPIWQSTFAMPAEHGVYAIRKSDQAGYSTKMGATHGCRSQTYRAASTVLPAPPTRKTLWYRTVQTHFETWLAHSTWQGDESTLPAPTATSAVTTSSSPSRVKGAACAPPVTH